MSRVNDDIEDLLGYIRDHGDAIGELEARVAQLERQLVQLHNRVNEEVQS